MTFFTSDLGSCSPGFPVVLPRWQAPTSPDAPITWQWPAEGKVRVRNLVSRGAMRATYRFTSVKLGRIVQLESSLEEQVALLLDACPTVSAYAEQPVLMEFITPDGSRSRHVPDLAVLHHGVPMFIEVKFSRDVDLEVLQRTRRLIDLLAPLGIGYRLVTEADLPAPTRLDNAWSLLTRGRVDVSPTQLVLIHERARHGATLGELGWKQPGLARQLARQILEGRISVDLSCPLDANTLVSTSRHAEGWLWA